jgi:hypothetical protein
MLRSSGGRGEAGTKVARLEHAVGRLPQQLDRRVGRRRVLLAVDALVGLGELEHQRIGAAPQQEDAAAILTFVAALHPAVHERRLVPTLVEPEFHGVVGADDELVDARLRRQQ